MRIYKAKVSATVELIVKVKEYSDGELEILEVDEVDEIIDFDNVRELG